MYWSRLRVFLILVLLVMVVLSVRLAQLQLARAGTYRQAAESNLIRPAVLLETRRGTIRDCNGLPLAEDVPHYDLCIYYPFLALRDPALIERKARREGRSVDDVAAELESYWISDRQAHALLVQIGRGDEPRSKLLQEMSDFWPELAEYSELPIELLDQRREDILRTTRIRGDLVRRQQRDDIRIREETYGRANSLPHAIISRGLNDRTKAYIVSLEADRPFLEIRERSERRYREGNLAGHVLGHLGQVNEQEVDAMPDGSAPTTAEDELRAYRLDDERGRDGVEAAMENVLRGVLGRERRRRDGTAEGTVLERVAPKVGQDVTLTLSAPFQRDLEYLMDHLEGLPADYGVPRGAIAVIDLRPGHEGGILALVSTPRYDPNRYEEEFPTLNREGTGHPYLHRAAVGTYPLGSCFKIVTAIAALQEGAITTGTPLRCDHYLLPSQPDRFTCLGYHSDIAVGRALCVSCNIFFYRAGLLLGRDRLVSWGRHFGFGSRIGIEGLNEAAGNLPFGMDSRLLAIGQGELTVTPLQAARMMALVAIGGRMTEVHLVQSPQSPERLPSQVDLGLRSDVLAVVKRALRDVVNDPAGTGYRSARSEQIAIAGKTGSPELGGDHPTHSWFVGYAPADRPQIAFAVVVEQAGHGSATAAPIGRKVVETALRQKLIEAK